MSIVSDLRILYHMALRPNRGRDHAQRMENFYAGQAADYDSFRKRLLQGRSELWSAIDLPRDGLTWVDMGGGTGSNLEHFGSEITKLSKIYVVDLSSSLLEVAARRVQREGWTNVEVVEADATKFRPPEGVADVVTFSYSLTMIPDWIAALDNAQAMLKPGGRIGIVDFYISRKHPAATHDRHGWITRHGWPAWFATDNVFLSPDHVPRLHQLFDVLRLEERRAKLPYLPLVRVPYYLLVGAKR
jgi:S-adenosylmethionine-diacylgycerolhomoserine-N-methlytransferase